MFYEEICIVFLIIFRMVTIGFDNMLIGFFLYAIIKRYIPQFDHELRLDSLLHFTKYDNLWLVKEFSPPSRSYFLEIP